MRQGEAKRKTGSVKIAGWCQHDGPRAVNADSPVEVLGPHLDLQIKFPGFSGVEKLQNGGWVGVGGRCKATSHSDPHWKGVLISSWLPYGFHDVYYTPKCLVSTLKLSYFP